MERNPNISTLLSGKRVAREGQEESSENQLKTKGIQKYSKKGYNVFLPARSSLGNGSKWKTFDVDSNINTEVLWFFLIPVKKKSKNLSFFPGMWVTEDIVNRFNHNSN